MAKLIIPSKISPLFLAMINALDKRHADACISVFIDKDNNQVTLIGGAPGEYTQIDIELEKGHGLKNDEFSIHFDFFMCMKEQKKEFHALSSLHIFQLNFKGGKYNNIEYCLLLKEDKKIDESIHFPMSRFDLDPAYKNHIEYRKENTQRAYHEINKRLIVDIIRSANALIPYDFVEYTKGSKEIRYQKNGEVTTKQLPDNINLPCSLPLTEAAAKTLTSLYNSSGTGKVEFSLEGEQLTFKTNQHIQSINLIGLESFRKKALNNESLLFEFSSNMFDFKQLNRMILKETSVRAINTAMLLFTDNRLFACILPGRREFIREINVNHFKSTNALLFSYSPRALNDIELKINEKGGDIRVTLTQNKSGELKLNFYNKPEDRLPFDSLGLISEQSQLTAYLKLKNDYLSGYGNRYIIQPSGQAELDFDVRQTTDVVDAIDVSVDNDQSASLEAGELKDELEKNCVASSKIQPRLTQPQCNNLSKNMANNYDELAMQDEYGFGND
ncbi:hypothetical protein [Shewanella sp. Isolate7]|uniref:hypothetical protein n=1 Tax=Shewanella sp. Isolate7 TaxID=2908528 RepID=UPI001EFC3300|nr:hypothetical protein [Shewanella sp. Isolate7]MCG9723103.1 hypothetical protein [Shewanella sp. Isolate7]